MTDLVPDDLETYSGPYGRFPAHQRPRVEPPDPVAQLIERLRQEVVVVRAANEGLRRERVEVEQALGRMVRAGELGPAVKMALYRHVGIH